MIRLKELRTAQGYTLRDISEATGYTKSFISQLERGLKKPSVDSLRKIADFLDVPIFALLEETEPAAASLQACTVLRPEEHRKIQLSTKSSVLYTMLTPNSGGGLEGYTCQISAGESSSGQLVSHRYAECTYVLEGRMTALVGESRYEVVAGGSIYIEPHVLHNFLNEMDEVLTLVGFYYI